MIGHEDCKVCHGDGYAVRDVQVQDVGLVASPVRCDCTRCESCWHEFTEGEERIADPDFPALGDTYLCHSCADEERVFQRQVTAALHDLTEHGWIYVSDEDEHLLERIKQRILPSVAYTVERIGGTWRISLEGK